MAAETPNADVCNPINVRPRLPLILSIFLALNAAWMSYLGGFTIGCGLQFLSALFFFYQYTRMCGSFRVDARGITLNRFGLTTSILFSEVQKVELKPNGLKIEGYYASLFLPDSARSDSPLKSLESVLRKKVPLIDQAMTPEAPLVIKTNVITAGLAYATVSVMFYSLDWIPRYGSVGILPVFSVSMAVLAAYTLLLRPITIVCAEKAVVVSGILRTRTYPASDILYLERSLRGMSINLRSGKEVELVPANMPYAVVRDFFQRTYGVKVLGELD